MHRVLIDIYLDYKYKMLIGRIISLLKVSGLPQVEGYLKMSFGEDDIVWFVDIYSAG